jgi:hypothetical protein
VTAWVTRIRSSPRRSGVEALGQEGVGTAAGRAQPDGHGTGLRFAHRPRRPVGARNVTGRGWLAGAVAVIALGSVTIAVESGALGTSTPGNKPTRLLANLFVGAAGSCTRSPTQTAFTPATACSTFQAAYDRSSCGDVVGVLAGTYTGVQIVAKRSTSSCTSYVTFEPAGGVVTFNAPTGGPAPQAHPCDVCALELGDTDKTYGVGLNPPSWIAFNGGLEKDFHFGTPGVEGSGGAMGQIKVYAAYGAAPNQYVASDHVKLKNLVICDACPDPGGGTVEFDNATNFTLSDSQIGPICCGLDSSGTPGASPTELLIGPRAGFPNPDHGLIVGNMFLGATRCGTYNVASSCTSELWPTSALGPAPQNDCDTSCHADAVHDDGDSNTRYVDNVFRNSEAQGLFMEGATSGVESDMTFVGKEIDSLAACGICAPTQVVHGHWTIAFNTVYPSIGLADPDAGVAQVSTTAAAAFTQPSAGTTITVPVASSAGFASGQYVGTNDGSGRANSWLVTGVPDGGDITIENPAAACCNSRSGTSFASGTDLFLVWQAGAAVTEIGNLSGQGNADFNTNDSGCGEWAGLVVSYSYNRWINSGGSTFGRCGPGDLVSSRTWSQLVADSADWTSGDNTTNFDLNPVQGRRVEVVPAVLCDGYQTVDLHGTIRPTSGFCDAGADQQPPAPTTPARTTRRTARHGRGDVG